MAINNAALIESRQKALLAAKAALEKHAEGVVVMDVSALSSVTDFFVICTSTSSPQTAAIADGVERHLARSGDRVLHVEGLLPSSRAPAASPSDVVDGLSWVLMDCGDVVVHVLNPPARDFYQLERLWGDAPRIPVESA